MKLCELYKIVDTLAPKALSDEYCEKYGAYDNSGVLVDTGEEVSSVVCSLDFSERAIDKALETGANVIVTHHPAIYGKISDIRAGDFQPLGRKLVKALRSGISVISAHLNLDVAIDGVDENLKRGVCLSAGASVAENETRMHSLKDGGYGRAYGVANTTLGALVENMKKTFRTQRIEVYGNLQTEIARVASFCGAGADEEAVQFAVEQQADVIVSSDFKHHVLALAVESGLAVIALTHYASEYYGFEKFYQKIRRSIEVPCVLHADEILL